MFCPNLTHHRRLDNFRSPSFKINEYFSAICCSFILLYAVLAANTYRHSVSAFDQNDPTTLNNADRIKKVNESLQLIRDWSSRFGREIHAGTQEATCIRSIRNQFDPAKMDPARRGDYKASIVSMDWNRLHGEIVKTISTTMGWHKSAVEAIVRASEDLAGNHTFVKGDFRFDYIDVHRIQNLNEEDESMYQVDANNNYPNQTIGVPVNQPTGTASDESQDNNSLNGQEMGQLDANGQLISGGLSTDTEPIEPLPKPSKLIMEQSSGGFVEWQTPMRELKLDRHKNFGDVLINTEESAVHTPVHIYSGDLQVINSIAWSEGLTKVFRDNFVRNPKLTNQYFAAQQGFLRLYPAQKWQIDRADPDLYDARMRPWYVAGASSRKDMIILVDSSGSMTGSRRDIAKGVVFELLDTLTDNDNFLILKFSDTIQQVGVPSCSKMRIESKNSSIPLKNTMFQQEFEQRNENETDIDSLFLTPANGRNVRHVKTNFTISTSGIANFSRALITAFEVLRNYQESEHLGAQCNQAIMLVTDGSPSDLDEIFNRYNYPNAPVRVFTYLIGREAGDVTHTKMMACHNRGYYTHVINLAEVRETVQQYIPVMARPLVLNGTHPITWTPAYGELTYQILTDWIWEHKRRDKAKSVLAAIGRGAASNAAGYVPDIKVTSDDGSMYSPDDQIYEASLEEELEAIDLFGYNSNTDCFWETRRNDLLTTVVQPVYDKKNESVITEKYLVKNVWTIKETVMRTAQILGVAAADMKINDIIALAPSHKLGTNGYAILLTNNGYVMHHPDLRSVLEPFSTTDPGQKNMRILKPYFSSIDFTQVEHILNSDSDNELLTIRKNAVSGVTGWGELLTKRTIDCQKRVQSRRQSFYYKPIEQFPFSFMIAIPQPYGSHKVHAQVEIKSLALPEKLTNYFTTSDYDIWTVHPEYQYCDGPSNNTITTLLDMLQRVEARKLDDIQWQPAESKNPPIFLPGKIVCDKDLVQSLVYDAVATFGFSENCGPPPLNVESSLLGIFGVRFSFIATRSGLTRVRHYESDDLTVKKEALAFARKHARANDETFYKRTVDYNMLINDNATLVQVPFNTYEKIRDRLDRYQTNLLESGSSLADPQSGTIDESSSFANVDSSADSSPRLMVKDMNLFQRLEVLVNSSLHVIATESIIVNEGSQRAVAGVTGVFYDYASFVLHFFNSTENRFRKSDVKCGQTSDSIDCLLVDNNGFIVVSEDLDYIGRHLKSYDPAIMNKLIGLGVFQEVNVTDYQSICMRQEEKQYTSSAYSHSLFRIERILWAIFSNLMTVVAYTWTVLTTMSGSVVDLTFAQSQSPINARLPPQQQAIPTISLLPNKTYLRPCEKTLTLYETKPGRPSSDAAEQYTTRCQCDAWFVYEQVPDTNLIMMIVDSTAACRQECDEANSMILIDATDPSYENFHGNRTNEEVICSMLERESHLYRKKIDSCFWHHPNEEQIKLCGGASISAPINIIALVIMTFISLMFCSLSSSAVPIKDTR